MKFMLGICVLATMTIVVAGCFPYKVPLSQPESSTIESRLIGEWGELGNVEGRAPGSMSVYQFNDHEYYIEVSYSDEHQKRDTLRMRGYSALVGNAWFINLQDIRNDRRGYTFIRYSLSDEGILTLRHVDDKWATSDLLTTPVTYQFIAKNLEQAWLYGQEIVRLKKIPNTSSEK